jgi:hypothetical protein
VFLHNGPPGIDTGMKKLALVLCLVSLAVPASAAPPAAMPWWTQRACPLEDSADCYWDAGAGNGTGHSFMVRQFPDGGPVCLMYVERRYARHHDRCSAGG